jgi:hypothetical protein
MDNRHSKSKARRRRNASTLNRRSALPKAVRENIEAQRRNLFRANSVLGCAAIAIDADGGLSPDVDYVDAMQAARVLISDVIGALDSVKLLSPTSEE